MNIKRKGKNKQIQSLPSRWMFFIEKQKHKEKKRPNDLTKVKKARQWESKEWSQAHDFTCGFQHLKPIAYLTDLLSPGCLCLNPYSNLRNKEINFPKLQWRHFGLMSEREDVWVSRKPVVPGEMRLKPIPFPTAFETPHKWWDVRQPNRFQHGSRRSVSASVISLEQR